MFEKLGALEERYEELGKMLGDPAVLADHAAWRNYARAHAELREVVDRYREYRAALAEARDARAMLAEEPDAETRKFLEDELRRLAVKKEALEDQLKLLLLPRDPNDEKSVFVEIRAGAGGEEAALFAADLSRMYMRYAERRGWHVDMVEANYTDIGGTREVVFVVEGEGAYSRLKYESGVHRVQRVPQTESGGRIHTSTATVAILPEADEVEVEIDPDDIRVDTFCARGPGGQSVNTTYSAVRLTHLPTGIVVSCQDEKSQHKNKEKAMRVLRARLLDMLEAQRHAEVAEARRMQVGTGDRSERIRTYNFPQGRVTDHRLGLTLHRLGGVLDGELDPLVDALMAHDQAERLKRLG